ncbi:MAG: ShlB/FhaC/HecB family hemolysin secretion/activation protein [Spirulinaceae cyanobacterium RM2_2_10]|nr:ShlB/FhaC/HecB family hemolysin secretion/activation protein [Spirulinaceae cyanobacterium RM2_2_10]
MKTYALLESGVGLLGSLVVATALTHAQSSTAAAAAIANLTVSTPDPPLTKLTQFPATQSLDPPLALVASLPPQTAPIPAPARQLETPRSPRLTPPLPEPPLPAEPLPPPEDLLAPPLPSELPDEAIPDGLTRIFVERFEFDGSTVFSDAELAAATAPFTGRELTFAELLQARAVITQLYLDQGYLSSGALIAPQTIADGEVQIQIVEGRLEAITVNGTQRLNPSYIRRRLALAGSKPLNVNRLLEGLQLLQLDPLIKNISAELQAAIARTRLLIVEVSEAKSFFVTPLLDNWRISSVGSFRRQIQFEQANLTGYGDQLLATYSNTKGSNVFDLSYTLPVNARNGTIRAGFGISRSYVIEDPFDVLDISSAANYYELSYRQPLILTPRQELAVGLTFTWQDSQTTLGLDDIGPFPLSPGADLNGSTRVAALRLFQEWTQRSERHVLALRSQFSVGLEGLFGASSRTDPPDSGFLAWRGQGQWVQLLAPELPLILGGDLQLSDRPLVPLEQIGLGGPTTVRGYRQEALLTDNAALLSAEIQIPIVRAPSVNGLLQVIPFIDFGTAWNNGDVTLANDTLLGTGIGLLWQMNDSFTARLDWGIPLLSIPASGDSLQANGIYFVIRNRF